MLFCYLCSFCNLLFYIREASVHPANELHLGVPFSSKFIRCPCCTSYHTVERCTSLDVEMGED